MSKEVDFKPGKRKYHYAIGRRKSAVATIRLYPKGEGIMVVNGKPLKDYFPTDILQNAATKALDMLNQADVFDATIKVTGGGLSGQADAVQLGFARALIDFDKDLRSQVKKEGLLTRDSRVKERKKYGLKGARRAPQWSKR